MENKYEESTIDLQQKKKQKIEPYITYDDYSGFFNMKDFKHVTGDQLISEVNKNGEDILTPEALEGLNRYNRNIPIPYSEDINMITEDNKTNPNIDFSTLSLYFYDLISKKPAAEKVSELEQNSADLSDRALYVIQNYTDPNTNELNTFKIQKNIGYLEQNYDENGKKVSVKTPPPHPPSTKVNPKFSVLSQMSLPTGDEDYVDVMEEDINNKQIIFDNQEPTLVTKEEMEIYIKKYQEYWENLPENEPPIANPEKCFTIIEINSTLLKGDLDAEKMCYIWRGNTDRDFGISGSLSIAGLTILAMRTLNVICNSNNLKKLKEKKIKFKKKPNYTSSIFYQENYDSLFNGAFKNINSGEGENRSNLDSKECQNLTTAMLNVMDEFFNNYFIFKNALSDKEDQGLTDFLRESYLLLRKIILIKSSLDVSMAEGLSDLVRFSNFCLFDSFDLSAVFNSPYCPTLSYLLIQGFQKNSLIYDDIAIFSYFSIIKYIIKNFVEWNEKNVFDEDVILKEIKKSVNDSNMDDEDKVLYNKIIEMSIDNKKLFEKEFYADLDISSNSDTSKEFTNFLNTLIGEKTIYIHLREMALNANEKNLIINKSRYESISKLFLNYNVERGVLNFEEITSNSRDIRAHDYAHSSIRFFGISLYIKKQICDFLREKFRYEINLNSIDDELFIKDKVERLSNDDKGLLVKFILNRESRKLNELYNTLKENLVNPNASGASIDPYIAKYLKFLNGYSYNPLDGYIDEIKYIYYLMCCQSAQEFESSQVVDGFDKAVIFQIKKPNPSDDDKIYMCNKQIFKKDNERLNKNKAKSLKKSGIILKNYDFPENTMGIVDLHHRNGLDEIINGITVQNTVNEADAASSFRGFYNFSLYIHKIATVFYNSISCATIFSGDYVDKYKSPESPDNNLINTLLGKGLIYFNLLINAEKYDITANTALPMIDYLVSESYQYKMESIINKIQNEDIRNQITGYYKQLISSFKSYYQMEQKSNKKKELAQRVSKGIKNYIKIFIQNTQLVAGCDEDVISILNKIGEEFNYTLLDDDVKIYTMIDKNTMRTSERSRESGKLGGAKNECENIIKNKEKDVPFDLYIGKFGSYIDAENGNLVLKAINTEEELKNIEMRLGIIDNNIKESTVPNTTPIKPNNPFKPPFQSPTSVEELILSPPEKKQKINGEINGEINGDINEGINGDINGGINGGINGAKNGGKTIKRRRRIKRKTRRIKNKNKHRKTVKRMKKRSKLTKVRKPRH